MHIAMELVLGALALFGLAYMWIFSLSGLSRKNEELRASLNAAREDLRVWKEASAQYVQGLNAAIYSQFEVWSLSEAEKDVALLLIKGCSLKEIAEMRKTSDRTVRQQAAKVYEKSKLAGRAELAAFFLDDIGAPNLGAPNLGAPNLRVG
jgi:DNA-binding NarL/FixJ family response regulator